MKTSSSFRAVVGFLLLLAPAVVMAQAARMTGGAGILGQLGLENDMNGAVKLIAWLFAAIWVYGGVLFAIARWRRQPGVSILVLRDTAISSMWMASILGSWIAVYYLLRAVNRALTYEDAAAGLRR